MRNTSKSKKWQLEKPERKLNTNKAKNMTFEENWGQIFATVWSKIAISDF